MLVELYNLSKTGIYNRAIKLGLKGPYFTANEAIRIGFNDGKFEDTYLYPEDGIYPSKLNNSIIRTLPDWNTQTHTQTVITK